MDFEDVKKKLHGPAVSMATPMKKNYDVDLEGLRSNVRFLIKSGFVNGSGVMMAIAAAGEANSLTIEERKTAMKAVAEEAKGKVPLVTSAQDPSLKNVVELSNYAENLGYNAVQVSVPFYFSANASVAYRFFKALSEQTGIGLMVYNTPWLNRGFSMDLDLLDKLVKIDSIVSFKWRSDDETCFLGALKRYADKVAFLANTVDPTSAHMMGAKMHLAIPGNFAPKYALNLWNLLEKKQYREALEELFKLHIPYYKWIGSIGREGLVGEGIAIKTPMEMVGLPAGPARIPYDGIVREELRNELRKILVNGGLKVVK